MLNFEIKEQMLNLQYLFPLFWAAAWLVFFIIDFPWRLTFYEMILKIAPVRFSKFEGKRKQLNKRFIQKNYLMKKIKLIMAIIMIIMIVFLMFFNNVLW